MRLGELVGLSKADVSFERGQIRVHRQWLDKQKCYGSCKGNNIRTIPMHAGLASVLKKAIDGSPHPEALFVTRTGRRVMARKVAGETFELVKLRAKVPGIVFHGLRHTFASHYMLNGVVVWDLMPILGHADVKMTQRYAHLSPRYLNAGVVDWSRSESLTNHSPDRTLKIVSS